MRTYPLSFLTMPMAMAPSMSIRLPGLEHKEFQPHHIRFSRTKSGELAKLQAEWSSKKPLSEFLSEIARKNKTSIRLAGNDSHPHQVDIDASNENNLPPATPDCADHGCLSCADRCLPGNKVTVVPLTDSRDYTEMPPKDRDFSNSAPKNRTCNNPFAWFYRSKTQKTSKDKVAKGNPAQRPDQGAGARKTHEAEMEMVMSSMKHEVSQANKKRDAAVVEVLELKKAIEEMGKKLQHLEHYCQSLKHASERTTGGDRAGEAGGAARVLDGEYLDRGDEGRLVRVPPAGSAPRFRPANLFLCLLLL